MDTRIIYVQEEQVEKQDALLRQAGEVLKKGGLVAFPTETVYGLGGDGLNRESSKKIYAAKGRPSDNPLIIHIVDMDALPFIVSEVSPSVRKVADAFWPGPLTMILPKSDNVPDETTGGLKTVAVRMPSHKVARKLIQYAGGYVAAPSANASGKPSPTRAMHVIDDLSGRIDAIIDGEDCSVGVESTIVDASRDIPVLLRPGGVSYEDIRSVVPETVIDKHVLNSLSADEKPLCPGMKYKHYSPKADVTVIEGNERSVRAKIRELLDENKDKVCGVLTMSDNTYDNALILSGGKSNKEYARLLFSNLREFDRLGAELVFAEFESHDGYGLAIRNRLYKAAGNKVIYV